MAHLERVLNGSRRVYLSCPKVGHGTPIVDFLSPKRKDGITPIYMPIYEYMLTTEAPPGTSIPEETVPCCVIVNKQHRDGQCAPRNCKSSAGAACHHNMAT